MKQGMSIMPTTTEPFVLSTIEDVVDLIKTNAESSNPVLAKHALNLLGPRKRGSTTSCGLERVINKNEPLQRIRKHPAAYRGQDYYQFQAPPELDARVGAIPFHKAYPGELIEFREGQHGPELFINKPPGELPPADIVTVIVGDYMGEPAVFTWYPGPLLDSIQNGIHKNTAVKVHNGE